MKSTKAATTHYAVRTFRFNLATLRYDLLAIESVKLFDSLIEAEAERERRHIADYLGGQHGAVRS